MQRKSDENGAKQHSGISGRKTGLCGIIEAESGLEGEIKMAVLSNLEPKEVFYYFEELCKIPHGSFDTKKISDYCVEFAKEQGLTWYQDETNNVIIVKEATPGYENAPAVIVQGHMDMVCEKTDECTIDFEKDGLELKVDGDHIYAEGTTLGGDDGIAVAYGLALLASKDIPHPKLEVVFTVDEEVGMLGAEAIDLSMLEGRTLINVDSEEEGIFLTSCAGGLRANLELPVSRVEEEGVAYEISLEGMTGGHSGTEIDKGHGNSNKLMSRFLYKVNQKADLMIETLEGGQKDNVIPRKTVATVLVKEEDCAALESAVKEAEKVLQQEQKVGDPNLFVKVTKKEKRQGKVLDRASKAQALMVLLTVPNGVQTMSMEVAGGVETSLNLGILQLEENALKLSFSVRSSVGTAKEFLAEKLAILIEYAGGTISYEGDYPAWEFQSESKIRDLFCRTYEEMFGKKPLVESIHAGLECGILSNKLPGLDCISLGPQMSGIHTSEEWLSVSSTERTWKLLLEVLKQWK
jgi:dipeptidase D